MSPPITATVLARAVAQARSLHGELAARPDRAELHHHARRALLDWTGVCLGALAEPEAARLAAVAAAQGQDGPVALLTGGQGSPANAAWLHGTLSHLLDFDDTHVGSILHTSGPVWAALWAIGQAHALHEQDLLDAYVVAFQFGARLGGEGLGERLTRSGWHVTPVLGRLAGALALALALRLPHEQAVHAVAIAATSAGGLTASFGSLAKPLHAGAAARDSVLAVQLAQSGATGAADVLDAPNGLLQTLLQDRDLIRTVDLAEEPWEVARNSFKPYASCQLTHASLDAARVLARGGEPQGELHAHVHPLAIQVAGRAQHGTSAQAKFSLPYCIALGMAGHAGGAEDFRSSRLQDARVLDWMARVSLHVDESATRESARLVHRDGTGERQARIASARGSAANPMGDADLRAKFLALAAPVLGERAQALGTLLLEAFGEPGSLARARELLNGQRSSA